VVRGAWCVVRGGVFCCPQAPGPTDQVSLGDSGKEVFLRAARASHWASAWCGAGEAALRIGDADEAEAALCEANTRDNYVRVAYGCVGVLACQQKHGWLILTMQTECCVCATRGVLLCRTPRCGAGFAFFVSWRSLCGRPRLPRL